MLLFISICINLMAVQTTKEYVDIFFFLEMNIWIHTQFTAIAVLGYKSQQSAKLSWKCSHSVLFYFIFYLRVVFHYTAVSSCFPQPSAQLRSSLQSRGRTRTDALYLVVSEWSSLDRISHPTPKWYSQRRHKVRKQYFWWLTYMSSHEEFILTK